MDKKALVKILVLADAHGIDMYQKADKEGIATPMLIRAMANGHRHAVLAQVTITDDTDNKIKKLLKTGDFVQALKVLKEIDINVAFPKGHVRQFYKSWQLIPNPKLDPYA